MTLGLAPRQADLFRPTAAFCEGRVAPGSIYGILHRARLARSAHPDRIFEVTLEAGKKAGLVGRRRVLDSTPLYDAVAAMDTVTLVRLAIRGLLAVAGEREAGLRALLAGDGDYLRAGNPACDYDDAAAREALVDAPASDARALLAALDGQQLGPVLVQANGAAGHGDRPGPGRRRRWGVPDCAAGRPGPDHLHG